MLGHLQKGNQGFNHKTGLSLAIAILAVVGGILAFQSCTRPPEYRQNLMDTVKRPHQETHRGRTVDNKQKDKGTQKEAASDDDFLADYPHLIRVRLYEGSKFPVVHYQKNFLAFDRSDEQLFSEKGGILRYNRVHNHSFVQVFSNGSFRWQGQRYQGRLFVLHQKKWQLILELPIEEYLKGVLPKEMVPAWPMEALKAQAIAARTYALFHIRHAGPDKPYHVDNSTRYQVFGGLGKRHERTNQAVEQTQGQIALHGERLFPAFFHSSTGGITERASAVWQGPKQGFSQVKKVPYGRSAPHYKWRYRVSSIKLMRQLKQKYQLERLKSFFVVERTESGRVARVRLQGMSHGKVVSQQISGNDFRLAVGAGRLKSTLFHIHSEKQGDKLFVVFVGRGYGHGVGMGQWEAHDMAQEGKSAAEIVRYFYKDVTLRRLRGSWPIASLRGEKS